MLLNPRIVPLPCFFSQVIPRGGKGLVSSVRAGTKIPTLSHADGVCHVFIDAAADPAKVTGWWAGRPVDRRHEARGLTARLPLF